MLVAEKYRGMRQFGKDVALVRPRLAQMMLAATFFGSICILFGWKVSAVVTLSVYVHELGYWFALKYLGVKTKGIYFRPPFFGAVTRHKAMDIFDFPRAFVCLSGPVAGLLCTVAYASIYLNTGNEFWYKAAILNAALNFINLIPTSASSDGCKTLIAVVATFSDRWVKIICMLIATAIVMLTGLIFWLKGMHISWYLQLFFFVWFPIGSLFTCVVIYSVVCKLPEHRENCRKEVEILESDLASAIERKQYWDKQYWGRLDPEPVLVLDKKIKAIQEQLPASKEKLEIFAERTVVRMSRKQAYIWGSLYLATTAVLGIFACI